MNVGSHCSKKSCNQLDFLPSTCHLCKHTFCQNHYKPSDLLTDDDHLCPQILQVLDRKAITCPICSQVVPVNRDQDPNIAVDLHLKKNCPKEKGTISPSLPCNKCAVLGCRKKEIIFITCGKCKGRYCIKHRLESDHKCLGKPQKISKNDCRIS